MKKLLQYAIAAAALALCAIEPVSAQTAWTVCAQEGGTCAFTGTKLVRYGEPWNNRWSQTRTMTSPVGCNNTTFSLDPSPGTGKRCEIMDAAAPAPSPPSSSSWTGDVTFEWTAPTTNTDGSPITLTPLVYEIVLTSADSSGAVSLRRVTVGASPFQFVGLPPGEHCGRILAIDSAGTRSDPSEQACKTLVAPPPGPLVAAVAAGVNAAPIFGITTTATGSSRGATVLGFVPVGKPCVGPVVYQYRGLSYRRFNLADAVWWSTRPTTNAAVACR